MADEDESGTFGDSNAAFHFLSGPRTVMRNKSAWLLGSLLSFVGCNLHDTSYLQAGEPNGRGGRGGSDSGGGASAGADPGLGGAGDGGALEGGSGPGGEGGNGGGGEGGDPSMVGHPTGGSDLGGDAGAGGVCNGAHVECESSDTITDFESNDGHLCLDAGGTVIAYGDGTGTQSPEIGDVRAYDASDDCDRGSVYAMHALGAGAKDYGFGIALRFPQNVDAVEAGYTGIRFKAKAAKSRKISLKVAIPATLDASFGGSCVPTQSPTKLCNDHPSAPVTVAAGSWAEYEVPFSSLKQEGWGVPATTSYDAVSQVHVVFPGPVSGGSADFDVWLDDFEFYK